MTEDTSQVTKKRGRPPKSTILSEWREKNMIELNACLDVAKAVRDDPGATARDRIEAVKTIGRLLSALTPDRVPPKKPVKKDAPVNDLKLTAAEDELIRKALEENVNSICRGVEETL